MKIVDMPDSARTSRQPVTNPKHTHMQIMFTSGSHFMVPIHFEDAAAAVRQWSEGSSVVSIRPTDGSAFHINVGTVIYLRQIDYATAERMLEETRRLNEQQIAAQEAQREEQRKAIEHNEKIRELQMAGAKTQAAKMGAIVAS